MRVSIFTLLFLTLATGVFASQNKKTLKLRLQSQTGNLDDATIYFDDGISPSYSPLQDAKMIFSNVPGVPEIYSFTTDKTPCSINGAGTLSSTAVVSLGYRVNADGLYNMSAIQFDNFNPTSIVTLEDRKLGVFIDLRQSFYQVQLTSNDTTFGRFFIHVSFPVLYSSTPSNCANNGGTINLTTDSTIVWASCQLYNDSNQLIAVDSNVNGTIKFKNLAAGNYYTLFTYNQYTAVQNFHLGGNYVVASIGIPQQPIFTLENVTFNGICTNANHYSWDFGDGTLIEGVANPDQTYYLPGTYTVNYICSNDLGCSATAQATVVVVLATGINNATRKDISITNLGQNVIVNMNDQANKDTRMQIFNLLGQDIYSQPITEQKQVVNVDGQTPGYYIVSVTNGGKVSSKRIFISK